MYKKSQNSIGHIYIYITKTLNSEWRMWRHWWTTLALQWRHNERDGVSNHRRIDCLLSRFRRWSKKTSKLHITGLCVGNSPGTGEFPAQRASNTENVPIWWCHHGQLKTLRSIGASISPRSMCNRFRSERRCYLRPYARVLGPRNFNHTIPSYLKIGSQIFSNWVAVSDELRGVSRLVNSDHEGTYIIRLAYFWKNVSQMERSMTHKIKPFFWKKWDWPFWIDSLS